MCGIAAILKFGSCLDDVRHALKTVEAAQIHRGPDDQGTFVESVGYHTSLGLGHQRLSILDLSDGGHQPMQSPSGRYVLVYNGEIYNYLELAKELGDNPILAISSGDTAVVLAALVAWGTEAFMRFNGMWALAFYDRLQKRLIVSRDRMGVKPLYVYSDSTQVVFASEIKAVLQICGQRLSLNRDVIARYLIQSITNSQNETFFDKIYEVPQATFADIDLGIPDSHIPKFCSYWQHPYEKGMDRGDDVISSERIRDTFLDAVELRLRSDVPIGILLSGGIDSSAILAAAKEAGCVDQMTALSVVSDDQLSNEEPYIDLMIHHAGCEVRKVKIDDNPLDLLDELPGICWDNDQPIASLSVVAHRKLMAKACEHGLKVLLTGQGSDEQLGGYNKFFYFYLADCLRNRNWGPALTMSLGCILQRTILKEFKIAEAKRYIPALRSRFKAEYLGEFVDGAQLAPTGIGSSYEEREWLDVCRLSLPMLLHHEDRMSMSSSREMRAPFMDYRLVEMLARVPPSAKLSNGWTKAIFREAMKDLLPQAIVWRKDKKGFNVPEQNWIRHEYRANFEEMFRSPMLAAEHRLINPSGIQKVYTRFTNEDSTISYKEIFNVYCLEIWLRRFHSYIARG